VSVARAVLGVLGVLVGLAALACPTSRPHAPAPRADGEEVVAGRFRFALPAGHAPSSRTQSIHTTKMWTTGRDDAGASTQAPPSSQPALLPGVTAAWFDVGGVRLLEATQAYPDHVVHVLRDAPAGKEAQAERLVVNLLRAYAPSSTTGFVIGHGAVRLGPAQQETVRLMLRATDAPERTLAFSTQTVARPVTNRFMDTAEEHATMRALGGRVDVLLERARTVAGLPGHEIRLLLAPPGEAPRLRSTWHFPGVAGDGTAPEVTLVAYAPPAQRAALDDAWEVVLGSLARVPP
jgi:hypothetical protein